MGRVLGEYAQSAANVIIIEDVKVKLAASVYTQRAQFRADPADGVVWQDLQVLVEQLEDNLVFHAAHVQVERLIPDGEATALISRQSLILEVVVNEGHVGVHGTEVFRRVAVQNCRTDAQLKLALVIEVLIVDPILLVLEVSHDGNSTLIICQPVKVVITLNR